MLNDVVITKLRSFKYSCIYWTLCGHIELNKLHQHKIRNCIEAFANNGIEVLIKRFVTTHKLSHNRINISGVEEMSN